MESLLEKLSSYNILNNLIPGAVFVVLSQLLDIMHPTSDKIAESVLVYYFCGMVVSRIGSLVVEELFKKFKLIKYAPKEEYIFAVKKDTQIESLLEINNMYRTFVGLFLTLGIMKGYTILAGLLNIPKWITIWLIIIALFALFSVSYVKQTKHIVSRVNIANKSTEGK